MHQIKHRQRSGVVLVAALVLVLQSFISAWATSTMAATPMLDAFGHVLCTTSTTHNGTTPPDEHSKLPDCCMFGCSMASPLLAADPSDGIVLRRPLTSSVLLCPLERLTIRAPDHNPASPRAPPLTA